MVLILLEIFVKKVLFLWLIGFTICSTKWAEDLPKSNAIVDYHYYLCVLTSCSGGNLYCW